MKGKLLDSQPRVPAAPKSIQKGSNLAELLGEPAITCLARNISLTQSGFKRKEFISDAKRRVKGLGLIDRGNSLAEVLREYLPSTYSDAVTILLSSLTPPLTKTEDLGLGGFFYLPHVCFVSRYGLDRAGNGGKDPFEVSMTAQYELTRRFSAEFSMRRFLIEFQDRTLKKLHLWTRDPDPHVRRLCSEGCRPRLPWAQRIPSLVSDPRPVLPILERLKDDSVLYVRRSVANHIGDIGKDNLEIALEICEGWLTGASSERKWLIRHALRYPSKKRKQAGYANSEVGEVVCTRDNVSLMRS